MQNIKKIKIIFIILGVILILTPLVIWITMSVTTIRQGIEFFTVPQTVTATIDGKDTTVTYESKISLAVGVYEITFKAENFEPETQKIEVKKGEITRVTVTLNPLNEAGRESINQSDYERIESGIRLNEGEKEINEKYPFVSKLPISSKYFSIASCNKNAQDPSEGKAVCVDMILDNEAQRNLVSEALQSVDIDPAKIEVYYSTPSNSY